MASPNPRSSSQGCSMPFWMNTRSAGGARRERMHATAAAFNWEFGMAAHSQTAHGQAGPLLALAPLGRRGIHHRLQVVIAGAHDDGARRPAHRLPPPHHSVCSPAHVCEGLTNTAATHDGEGLRRDGEWRWLKGDGLTRGGLRQGETPHNWGLITPSYQCQQPRP